MKTKKLILLLTVFIFNTYNSAAQLMVPDNTATHTAVANGNWFTANTWDTNTVPSDGAIVVIPFGKTVTYEGQSVAHIFLIKVAGNFVCTQTNSIQTTTLTFDTMMGTMQSKIQFLAGNTSDGKINVTISPFDIEVEKSDPNTLWNTAAKTFFSDGALTYEVERYADGTGNFSRFNTWAEAQASDTHIVEGTSTAVNDGPGVLGRWNWDPNQASIGLMAMGEFEIIGQEKTNMVKLAQDAAKQQKFLHLESTPLGWEAGDQLVITSGGNLNATANGVDQKEIDNITGSDIECTTNLNKNHFGRAADNLHCYVGNLTRNITFKSGDITEITRRGHVMAMFNDTNVQYKNAAFVDLGRTDKSKLLDDFIWNQWVEAKVFRSKYSALGQECADMIETPIDKRVNMRGRYSIHLHRLGAVNGSNMAEVTGNVVWGNPGWGITHHDSHANVSNNVVYDVLGSGIVSEMGNETGFWDDNLVVEINKSNEDVYNASLFHDDYLFSGQGLGMKGRGVICRGNVISDAKQGIGIDNFNAATDNLHRHDAEALANLRGIYNVDNFPLSVNGYSKEGDGVMPLEVALIFENTTIINCNIGFKSIERDMGVNHESRSIFDDFKVWGAGSDGIRITYQADYSFKDVFISGSKPTSKGIYMWKHSHNHVFDGIKLVDLEYGISVSKLVEKSGNANSKKTRNNDYTPWNFIDLVQDNVGYFYKIEKDDDHWPAHVYDEHSDNPIHFSSSEITSRPTTFTLIENNIDTGNGNDLDLEIDVTAGDFTFAIDGVITDDLGSYNMGLEQAPAQGTLRLDYPSRIYEFASQAKFEEYLTVNGVYKDVDNGNQLYFILNEALPNRRTFEYTTFPIKININNTSGGVYATATSVPSHFDPTLQMISRFATAAQSSTATDETYYPFASTTAISGIITHEANKAIDGNTNGRKNANIFQDGLVPVGSFSETQQETEPWYDLDLGEEKVIEFIDIWNTVELNGADIETMSTHFKNFYVLISNTPFGSMDLTTARTNATYEFFQGNITPKRKIALNNLNERGQYVRIQAEGNNKIIKLAEVEIIGKKYIDSSPLSVNEAILKDISIYPNPTSNIVNINLNKTYKATTIKVSNILGQVILLKKYKNAQNIAVNIEGASGVYFVEIDSNTEEVHQVYKIVKK